MYAAQDIARFVIWYSKKKDYSINNLKLQKIMYFLQADYIVNKNTLCFSDDIDAWDMGPVISGVYHKFAKYGSAEIPLTGCEDAAREIRLQDQKRIARIIDNCARYSTPQLTAMTLRQEAWKEAYERQTKISPQAIRRYCFRTWRPEKKRGETYDR